MQRKRKLQTLEKQTRGGGGESGEGSCHFSCINVDVIIDASGERCLIVESILQLVRYLHSGLLLAGTVDHTVDLGKKKKLKI